MSHMEDKFNPQKIAQFNATSPNELWMKPRPQELPRPTYAPAVTALAIVCILWGAVTTYLISLVGLLLLVAGLSVWIGEFRHECK